MVHVLPVDVIEPLSCSTDPKCILPIVIQSSDIERGPIQTGHFETLPVAVAEMLQTEFRACSGHAREDGSIRCHIDGHRAVQTLLSLEGLFKPLLWMIAPG